MRTKWAFVPKKQEVKKMFSLKNKSTLLIQTGLPTTVAKKKQHRECVSNGLLTIRISLQVEECPAKKR